MSDPKPTTAEPDIPSELRSKLSTPRRPGFFQPKSPEADGNPPIEEERGEVKDLTDFFQKLHEAVAQGSFFRTEVVEREKKVWNAAAKEHEFVREKRAVKVPVELLIGQDGLPYPASQVSIEETRRVRQLFYKEAPSMSPTFGDLTPDFVEWLYLNHPYDACVRYFGRSTHVQAWAISNS